MPSRRVEAMFPFPLSCVEIPPDAHPTRGPVRDIHAEAFAGTPPKRRPGRPCWRRSPSANATSWRRRSSRTRSPRRCRRRSSARPRHRKSCASSANRGPMLARCSRASSTRPRGYCAATWRSCCFATATPIFTRPGRRRRVRWRTSRPTGSRLILTPTFPRAPSSRSRSCIYQTGRRSTFPNTNAAFTKLRRQFRAVPAACATTTASAFSRWPEVGRTCSARAKSRRPVRFATKL